MRSLLKEYLHADRPWMVITAGFFLYTLYDFYDHVSRVGSSFEENAFLWLLFSLASLLTIIAVMFFVTQGLNRLFKGWNILKEVAGLIGAVFFHIQLSGPFYNRVFWGEEILNFHFKLVPVLLLCGIYLFLRMVIFNGIRHLIKSRSRSNI